MMTPAEFERTSPSEDDLDCQSEHTVSRFSQNVSEAVEAVGRPRDELVIRTAAGPVQCRCARAHKLAGEWVATLLTYAS